MVKITNISGRPLSRRTPRGQLVRWMEGSTVEVESKRLLEELDKSNAFARQDEIGKETGGGGLKTGVRRPKRLGRPPKSRKHVDKSKQAPKEEVKCKKCVSAGKTKCECKQAAKEVKPPKSVIDKVKRAKPKTLKKPKGLKRKKKGKAD